MSPLLFALPAALAQGLAQHHPEVPAASVAAENGPGALWVNPANLAFDPDPRFGLTAYRQDGFFPVESYAGTVGVQGLQVGLHHLRRYDARGELLGDWSLDYGTSIPLPERVAVGALLSWHFVDDGLNYVAYDAGVSWRPLPWLGVAGVAQNAGSPDPQGEALARTAGGIALRPLGDLGVLGLDFGRTFAANDDLPDEDSARAALRLRPIEGLYVRASADVGVDLPSGTLALNSVGAGLELYIDGFGGGAHGAMAQAAPFETWVFAGTDEPGESLIRAGRRVQVLELDTALPYAPRATLFSLDPGPSYLEMLERLRAVERDRSVKGLVLAIRGPGYSWAQWQELRARIQALRDEGRYVVAYLDGSAGNGAYFLATAADAIWMHPGGELGLVGLNNELQNLRGLLDLVGVEPQFVRRSEYKSAPEQFTQTEPTPAALEATQAFVDDLYRGLVAAVSTRAEDEAAARDRIDAGPWAARDARDAGLVDDLLYPDELQDALAAALGGHVELNDLLLEPQAHSPWDDPAAIAVIYVEGAIVDGESSPGGFLGSRTAGADTIARDLDRAANDQTVRAVVIRVDSPGGSALASDRIWRAIEEVQETGKPVVVSMGGLAASGGYYVSAGADVILAEPGTLTGSIGVFGGKFSMAELFDDVGIGVTPITRGRNADLYSASRPWDDVQRAKVQSLVDETYLRFKTVVSDGRGLTMDEVEGVARGRVWTGERAVENGLVDEIGGLQDAVAKARDLAGIRPGRKVGLVSYSPSGSLLQTVAPALVGRVLGPLDDLVVSRRPAAAPLPELDALEAMLPDLAPFAVLQATHPEVVVWMVDPWLAEPTTR